MADGERAETNHGAVEICGEENNGDARMDVIEEWLQQHSHTISSLDGAKTLEIQSFIETNEFALSKPSQELQASKCFNKRP